VAIRSQGVSQSDRILSPGKYISTRFVENLVCREWTAIHGKVIGGVYIPGVFGSCPEKVIVLWSEFPKDKGRDEPLCEMHYKKWCKKAGIEPVDWRKDEGSL